jgi:hypothetical protein
VTGRSLYVLGVFIALVGFFAEQARCTMLQRNTARESGKPVDRAGSSGIAPPSVPPGPADDN